MNQLFQNALKNTRNAAVRGYVEPLIDTEAAKRLVWRIVILDYWTKPELLGNSV